MQLIKYLNRPTYPQGLALFRILFGLIVMWDLKRISDTNLIESFYAHDKIFYYEFLKLPLPDLSIMKLIMVVLFVCTVLITIGLFYRWAMTLFAIGFSFFFFQDPVLYNNHLYMLCLLSFMMIFIPADAAFSVNKSRRRVTIPQWSYRLLQFQLIVVFFFGGIVKLNPYWFNFHPVEEVLHAVANRSGLDFFNSNWMKYVFTYGGIAFDLLIGPLLLIRKTRKLAIFGAIAFNLINSYVFNDIFIFPFFMIAALLLFLDQEKLKNRLDKLGVLSKTKTEISAPNLGKIGLTVIGIYAIVQLLLPLRHYFIEGYTDWTGEAQRFSWRMKIQCRKIEEVKFAIFDIDKKMIHEVDPYTILYPDEVQQMCHSPQMILQFAHYLKDVIAPKNQISNLWIKSKVKVRFNGSKPGYIFDPDLDLIEASEKNEPIHEWINPIPK